MNNLIVNVMESLVYCEKYHIFGPPKMMGASVCYSFLNELYGRVAQNRV